MEISNSLLCLFSASVEEKDGSFVIEIPERELNLGDVERGEVYRFAVLPAETATEPNSTADSTDRNSNRPARKPERETLEPPVAKGEQHVVEIEDIGEQGDGVARVDRGYVVIVPDTEKGERVTIEITDTRENVGFGKVVSREDYYQ